MLINGITLHLWSSFECGFNWIGFFCKVKVNVLLVGSKDGASPISRSHSGAKTNTPAIYCTGPSTRHSTRRRISTNHHCTALEQLSERWPATSVP